MKAVNLDEVIRILRKYGKYIFVTDEKKYSSMVDEIANLKALEQEPCEDAISRQEVLDLAKKGILISNDNYKCVCRAINDLPSVNLVKTGHWISTETKGVRYAFWCRYKCSLCGGLSDRTNFCPNCGAKMVEPQETETWNGIHAQITAPKGTFERILNDADDDNDI